METKRFNAIWVLLLDLYIVMLFLGQHQFNTLMRVIYAVLVIGVLLFNIVYLSCLNLLTKRLLLLILYSFISCIWAANASTAFTASISMAQCALISVSIYVLVDDKDKIRTFLWCIVIAMVVFDIYVISTVGLSSLAEMSQQGIRPDMTEDIGINANSVGYLNAMVMPLLLYLCAHGGKKIFLLLEVLFGACVVFSASRTAVFMLLLGIILYALLIQQNKKIIRTSFGIAVVLIVVYFLASQGYLDTIFDRFGQAKTSIKYFFTQDSKVSGDGNIRMRLIRAGLEFWTENPIFGHGAGQFNALAKERMGVAYSSHNAYTQALVSFGVLGLFLWQGMYITAIKRLWKKRTNLDTILVILIVVWLFGDIFSHSMNDKMSYVLIGLCYAQVNIKNKDQGKDVL